MSAVMFSTWAVAAAPVKIVCTFQHRALRRLKSASEAAIPYWHATSWACLMTWPLPRLAKLIAVCALATRTCWIVTGVLTPMARAVVAYVLRPGLPVAPLMVSPHDVSSLEVRITGRHIVPSQLTGVLSVRVNPAALLITAPASKIVLVPDKITFPEM